MSKRIIIFSAVLVAIFVLPIVSIAYAGPPGRRNAASKPVDLGYVPGELLVRFAPKANGIQRSRAEKNQIVSSLGPANVTKDCGNVPGLSHVKLPPGITVEQAMARLNKRPDIIYAQPNHYLMLTGQKFPDQEKDPLFANLWGMHNVEQTACTGQTGTLDADIDAPEAWDIKTDASDIIVAVIDSGVDYYHQDLAANIWINPGEDQDPLGVITEADWNDEDDDENGFVDDICGYDFCTIGKTRDSDPKDDDLLGGHGTHIAGTIGARGNNDYGVTGVCWKVKIMALRLFLNTNNFGEEEDAIDCIKYAVDNGARVISASWGRYRGLYPYYQGWPQDYSLALRDAIEDAGKNGVLFVAAANNMDNDLDDAEDGYPFDPASYDLENIISVMATDCHDERSDWEYWKLEIGYPSAPFVYWRSNYGAVSVDLAAPGTCIWSCVPYEDEEDDKYQAWDGTSMATPHVSGACALMWAINPTLSHLEVKGIILSTVDELESLMDDPEHGRLCVTGGRLNLGRAAEVAADYAPVFSVKDNNGNRVMWFDDFGNLFVKGRLSTGQPGQNEGIEGHWTFDEGSGQTAYDSGGGGNHGRLGNSSGPDANDPTWVTGKIAGALDFDGADDYVYLSPIAALQGSTVTVAAWIKADDTSVSYDPIVTQYDYNYNGYDLCLMAGKPSFWLDMKVAQAHDAISSDWHHLAGTYDGQELRIYVDGASKDSNSSYPDHKGKEDTPAYIGRGNGSAQDAYFGGIIDDVRVYNYAMRCSEVRELLFPNSSRFRVCNSSDETVSWFDDSGYGWFKGAIHERQNSLDPESNETDDFVVRNSDNDVVAFISDSGDLYLKGSLYEYEE